MVTLIPQPGDGNCAYHAARASISSALKHLVPESKGFTIDAKFVDSIFRETLFTVTRNLALAFHDQAQKVAKVPVTPQDCFQAVWDAGIDSPHLRLLLDGASSIRDYRGPDDIGTATEFARILIQDTEAAASKAIQAVLSHIYEHWADSQALALLALGLNVHILVTTRADWSLSPLYVAGSPQERSPVGLVLVYNGSTHYDNLQMDGSVAFAHVEYHDGRKPKWPSAGFLAKLKAHATSPTSAPIPSRVPCQQVPVATVATVTIQAVDATGTMSTCPVCCEHVRITRKGLRDGRHKCPGPSVSSTSAPSTAAPSTREPHTRAPRPSKPRGSGATHAPQLSPVVNPVSMVSSPVSPVLPVSPQVTPAVSTEMACRVQGCVESFHGAASLVDHLKETHGVHDSALDGLLASLSIFRCGSACKHGPQEGKVWRRALFDGYIHEHDDCPTFAALKPRHMATIALVVEARRVEAELSKSDEKAGDSKERSARSLLRSLVSRIAANDPAGLAADTAGFLDANAPPLSRHPRQTAESPAQHASNCIQRAGTLLQENEFGRAMRALTATPNLSVDDGNDEVVRGLFPPGPATPPQSLRDLESIRHAFLQRT